MLVFLWIRQGVPLDVDVVQLGTNLHGLHVQFWADVAVRQDLLEPGHAKLLECCAERPLLFGGFCHQFHVFHKFTLVFAGEDALHISGGERLMVDRKMCCHR